MCPSCGATGSCSCASITIPTGPAGPTGATGATGATGPQGVQGLTGPQGAAGTTANKYAVTLQATGGMVFIPETAITNSGVNPLLNTWASTPRSVDFNVTVWKSSSGANSGPWVLITHDSTNMSSPTYTEGTGLSFTVTFTGYMRVIVQG